MKKILLLGAGLMQVPARNAVKEKNYTLIIADANKDALLAKQADEFWHIDLRNIPQLVKKAQEQKIDAVFTCATDFTYAVSCIAQACKVAGITPEIAEKVNYKHHMRTLLAEHKIPSPAYSIIHSTDTIDLEQIKKLGYPLVVKPVDNMGARGVRCVHLHDDIISAIHYARTYSPTQTVILEQKLDGPELSIDSFVIDGILYPIGIADRHIYFEPFFIEMGHSIPSLLHDELIQDACQLMQKMVQALECTHKTSDKTSSQKFNGAFKGDIIFHKNKAYIGECAARLSGGYMSGWTIPYAYKTYPAEQALDISLKKHKKYSARLPFKTNKTLYKKTKLKTRCCTVERAIISLPGTITNIHIPQHLQSCNSNPPTHKDTRISNKMGIKNIIITAKVGDTYQLPENNTQKVGSIISTGKTFKEANSFAYKVLSEIYCEIKPNREADTFLFSRKTDDKLRSWHCYPQCLKAYYQELDLHYLDCTVTDAHIEQAQRQKQLPIYMPDSIKLKQELGTWTHSTIAELFNSMQEYVYLVPRWQDSLNDLALRAILRGGYQAIHYTLQALKRWQEIKTFSQ